MPLTFRVPEPQRQKLRALLLSYGLTLQDWGRCVVAEHLGLTPNENVRAAIEKMSHASQNVTPDGVA